MTNQERITSNNALIDEAIAKANSLPDAGGGGAPVEEKDVNFYDYDGTLLYSYTLDEIQALSELPPLPEHDGLVCQGWNWTLQGLKNLNRAMNVGAVYITDDGKTRLYFNITNIYQCDIALYFIQSVSDGVTVDWGDGTAPETIGGTGAVNISHIYADIGKYVISLDVTDGTMQFGANSVNYSLIGEAIENNRYKTSALKKIEIGSNVQRLGGSAFRYILGLQYITIPNGVTIMWDGYIFSHARNLKFVVVPSTVTDLGGALIFDSILAAKGVCVPEDCAYYGAYLFAECANITSFEMPDGVVRMDAGVFSSCKEMKKIKFPDTVKNVGASFFRNCQSLTEITIPTQVESIAANAFEYCYGMHRMKFLSTTPPTVANANAFNGIPTTCVVEVPKGTLATYQAATNYSGISAQMVEADE